MFETSSNSSSSNNAPSVGSQPYANEVVASQVGSEPQAGIPNSLNQSSEIVATSNMPVNGAGSWLAGYSVATLPNNTAIIAYAAPAQYVYPVYDDQRAAKTIESSRIFLTGTYLSSSYTGVGVRSGTLVPVDDNFFELIVDETVYNDVASVLSTSPSLNTFRFLDGPFANKEKYARSFNAGAGNSITLPYYENEDRLGSTQYCVHFVAFTRQATNEVSPLTSLLNNQSPLPFITANETAIPAINPQVVVRRNGTNLSEPYYIYVFAEAPIDGVYQIFMYGLRASTALGTFDSSSSSYDECEAAGWTQLTFVGENRGVMATIDQSNTIRLVWQSSRCQPQQLYYGALGPMSHVLNNEILISMIDKQAYLGQQVSDANFIEPLVEALAPTALDLTQPGGIMWSKDDPSTGVTISGTSITISGNPSTTASVAFTCLDHDERGRWFDDTFKQLSFQVGFNLSVGLAGVTSLSDSAIAAMYQSYLSQFAVVQGGNNTNVFKKSNNIYTVSPPERVLNGIVPVVGAYKFPSLKAALEASNANVSSESLPIDLTGHGMDLRHFFLGLVPEQVSFTAVNAQTQTEFLSVFPSGTYTPYIQETFYTGRLRLALLVQSSGNGRGYKPLRFFGPWIQVGVSNNYKIAVHYSHLNSEAITSLATYDIIGATDNSVRFHGDIIVMVNNVAAIGETFFADFSDEYSNFDIGFGATVGGQFKVPALIPYDCNLFANIVVTSDFADVAIGPHSVVVNPSAGHISTIDRLTAYMWVDGELNGSDSDTMAEDIGEDYNDWLADYGTMSQSVSLTQLPITFVGVNTSPSVCLDACDVLHVVWQSNRNSNWDIYYSNSLDFSHLFHFDTRITNLPSNSLSPSIGVDGLGRRVIAWHDDRSGQYQIYVAYSLTEHNCQLARCLAQHGDAGSSSQSSAEEIALFDASVAVEFNFVNTSSSTLTTNFNITFYDSDAMTTAVFSASTATDIRNWYGNGGSYAAGGVVVAPAGSLHVVYYPSVLAASAATLTTGQALLCGVTYYAKVEVNTGAGWSEQTQIQYLCPCNDVNTSVWLLDDDSSTWTCSGQGQTDLTVTDSDNNAVFAVVAGSWDGIAYIAWEDHRFTGVLNKHKQVSPGVFSAHFDLNTNTLYSSAQQYPDHLVAYGYDRFYHPQILLDAFLNPTVFYTDRFNVRRISYSLAPEQSQFFELDEANLLDGSSVESYADGCLRIAVYSEDVTGSYYNSGSSLINTVGKCFVRLDIQGPPGSRGFRLQNEDGIWSEWLSILPELPGQRVTQALDVLASEDTQSEDNALGSVFEAYFIGDDRFISPWVLSAGTGAKTVSCEVLTAKGRTSSFSVALIAAYDEFPYQINFFQDSAFTIPLPRFNGVPVASTQQIVGTTLTSTNFAAITAARAAVNSVYFTVVFTDKQLMADIMNLGKLSTFSNAGTFTFDVVRNGTADLLGQTFTSSDLNTWTFQGTFPITVSDGASTQDGLALVRVNIPDPRVQTGIVKAGIVKLDNYNFMGNPAGNYGAVFSPTTFSLSAADIQQIQIEQATAAIVTNDQFREIYRPELLCTFLSRSCTGVQPNDLFSDSNSSSIYDSLSSSLEPVCVEYSWKIRETAEPGYYLYGLNQNVFLRHSPPYHLDLRDPGITGVRFNSNSRLDGILFMIRGNDEVTVSSWSGVGGSPVTFAVPTNTIVFGASPGYYYCNEASAYCLASSQKTFTMVGGTTVVVPQGSTGTDQTGTVSLFSAKTGWTTYSAFSSVPRSVLKELGFLSTYDQLYVKFVHVVCGTGFLTLEDFTCNSRFLNPLAPSSSNTEGLSSDAFVDSGSDSLDCTNVPIWPFGSGGTPENVCNSTSIVLFQTYSIGGGIPHDFLPSSSSDEEEDLLRRPSFFTHVAVSGPDGRHLGYVPQHSQQRRGFSYNSKDGFNGVPLKADK